MNPLITLDPIPPPATKSILAKNGYQCSVLTLAAGEEMPLRATPNVEEHILVVLEGEATLRFGLINTMLKPEEAVLIAKGQPHSIAASSSSGAKILQVDVPPRQVITPQILTMSP